MSEEKRPKVGVGVIVVKEGKILFLRRKGAHGEGTWSVPGGHLEFGESIEECAFREVEEETGIKIKNVKVGPFTNDIFNEEDKHYITVYAIAEHDSGDPESKEEFVQEVHWADWGELPKPLFIPFQNLIDSGFDFNSFLGGRDEV